MSTVLFNLNAPLISYFWYGAISEAKFSKS